MDRWKHARPVRVHVTDRAKDVLEALRERRGMTQAAALSRLIEWVAAQPWDVQLKVLQEPPSEPPPHSPEEA